MWRAGAVVTPVGLPGHRGRAAATSSSTPARSPWSPRRSCCRSAATVPRWTACRTVVVGDAGRSTRSLADRAGRRSRDRVPGRRPRRAALHRRHHRPEQGRRAHPRQPVAAPAAPPRERGAHARRATRGITALPLSHAFGLLVTVGDAARPGAGLGACCSAGSTPAGWLRARRRAAGADRRRGARRCSPCCCASRWRSTT